MNFKKMVLAAVAMVFAFSAHSGELVKKKDSFAEAAPPNFAMAHAVEGQTCHRSGDIGMSTDGLILSCQSGVWAGRAERSVRIVRNHTYGDGSYALCADDEVAVGGGGRSPGIGLDGSYPASYDYPDRNGWTASGRTLLDQVEVFALCMKR